MKRSPSYLIVKDETHHVIYKVEAQQSIFQITDARELNGHIFPLRTIDFIQSASNYATLTEEASQRMDKSGMNEFTLFPSTDFIEVSKPNATYMLVSKVSGAIITAGGYDTVSKKAQMSDLSITEMVACVNWLDPKEEI